MKKIVCVLVSILLIGVLALIGKTIYENRNLEVESHDSKYREEGWLQGEYEAYFVSQILPTDIIWYGEWTENEFEIPVRFETDVSREVLKIRDGYQKCFIVVNELDTTAGLEKSDYEMLASYINNDERYNMLYVGEERLEYLAELLLGTTEPVNEEDLSIGFFRESDSLFSTHGDFIRNDLQFDEENYCTYWLSAYVISFEKE